jgi:hypothetical protein
MRYRFVFVFAGRVTALLLPRAEDPVAEIAFEMFLYSLFWMARHIHLAIRRCCNEFKGVFWW